MTEANPPAQPDKELRRRILFASGQPKGKIAILTQMK